METKLKIGYLPLTKQNWTNATLEKARADALAYLKTLPGVEVVGGEKMIETEAEALEVLKDFELQRPDLLVTHFMTFTLGVVPPLFAQRLGVPVVLWSMPEPSWSAGGRLERNSFCATNMNSHHLWKLHIPYFWVYADAGTPEASAQLDRVVRTAKAMKMLKTLRIGVIGGRVPGFYTSCVNELVFRRLIGPELKYITEHEVLETARAMPKDEIEKYKKIILEDADVDPADAPKTYADYVTFVKAASPIGKATVPWQDFVADTNPADSNDVLRALITIGAGNLPKVSWEPDRSDKGGAVVRSYTLRGANDLATDPKNWDSIKVDGDEDAKSEEFRRSHNFFRVEVALP